MYDDDDGKVFNYGVLGIFGVLAVIWWLLGFYSVEPGEMSIEMVFGAPVAIESPGLNHVWFWPVGTAKVVSLTDLREISVGRAEITDAKDTESTVPADDGIMLTGDENIVDLNFKVFWQINDIEQFVFEVQDTESTVRAVSEAAMRTIVGESNLDAVITENRAIMQEAAKSLIQETLDDYKAGVTITEVKILRSDPPLEVIAAYRDVQAARADQEKVQNDAETYANRVVPEARGEAEKIMEEARAYKESVIAEATGRADRFSSVLEQYKEAPGITSYNMIVEATQEVLKQASLFVVSAETGSGIVPYLPLNELNKNQGESQQ